MTDPLRPAILTPARPHMRHLLAATLGATAIGAAFSVRAHTSEPRAMVQPPRPIVEPIDETTVQEVIEQPIDAQSVRSLELGLVFSAGGATYMKLTEVGDAYDYPPVPKHSKPKLISKDGVESAIATVSDADVPDAYRRWQGRKVIVDNDCETTVTGFAVIGRLTGDTGYAGLDDTKWTAKNVLASGATVLAARLADCSGTYARDAALPAVVVPATIVDNKLASRARAALIASEPARDTQIEYAKYYADYEGDGQRHGNWWDEKYTSFHTRIVRHPTTGVTWVSVHASMDHSCGDPTVNVWGLYRVEADGSLTATQQRKLDDLWSIDQLIDIDNDGELEVIGTPWLGLDTVVVHGSGEELDRLQLPFFGCPC